MTTAHFSFSLCFFFLVLSFVHSILFSSLFFLFRPLVFFLFPFLSVSVWFGLSPHFVGSKSKRVCNTCVYSPYYFIIICFRYGKFCFIFKLQIILCTFQQKNYTADLVLMLVLVAMVHVFDKIMFYWLFCVFFFSFLSFSCSVHSNQFTASMIRFFFVHSQKKPLLLMPIGASTGTGVPLHRYYRLLVLFRYYLFFWIFLFIYLWSHYGDGWWEWWWLVKYFHVFTIFFYYYYLFFVHSARHKIYTALST